MIPFLRKFSIAKRTKWDHRIHACHYR